MLLAYWLCLTLYTFACDHLLLGFCLFVQYGLEQYDEEEGRRRLRRQRRALAGATKRNENDVIRKAMKILRSGDNFELVGA